MISCKMMLTMKSSLLSIFYSKTRAWDNVAHSVRPFAFSLQLAGSILVKYCRRREASLLKKKKKNAKTPIIWSETPSMIRYHTLIMKPLLNIINLDAHKSKLKDFTCMYLCICIVDATITFAFDISATTWHSGENSTCLPTYAYISDWLWICCRDAKNIWKYCRFIRFIVDSYTNRLKLLLIY